MEFIHYDSVCSVGIERMSDSSEINHPETTDTVSAFARNVGARGEFFEDSLRIESSRMLPLRLAPCKHLAFTPWFSHITESEKSSKMR